MLSPMQKTPLEDQTNESTWITTFKRRLLDVPIFPFICCERICFKKQTTFITIDLAKQLSTYLEIFISCEEYSYICTSCLKMINNVKFPLFKS